MLDTLTNLPPRPEGPRSRPIPRLVSPTGRRLRLVHLTTVDMSLALLLGGELAVDVEAGLDVWGMSAPGPYTSQLERLGVHHVAVPSLSRRWQPEEDARAMRELVGALRTLAPDVLHTHTPKAGVFGRLIGRAVRVPVVVNTCHGLWLRTGDGVARRAAVLAAESVAAAASHAELFQNADDLQMMRRAVGRRGTVVGNGVALERFQASEGARRRVRRELGIAPDELLVGAVGRFVAEKGVAEMAVCADRLRGRARFVWVGPDDGEPELAADGSLRRIGARTDMPAIYAALDVFVLPSHREGFSRSAMEAAASGVAMVLTDIRGCREIGAEGEHLLLVPPGDADALTAAVQRLLDDDTLRRRLGVAARRRALTHFDQREVARRSLEAYARAAASRGLGWRQEESG